MELNKLRGRAKQTYTRVINAINEDEHAGMSHAFASLTEQAKNVVLKSGYFSNAYVRGNLKEMEIQEAGKDLTARRHACILQTSRY